MEWILVIHILLLVLTWLCGVRLIYYKKETFNIYYTIQCSIRCGLASVLADGYVNCNNKQVNPNFTRKEKNLKYLNFNSLFLSAIVQVLYTGEINVCKIEPQLVLKDIIILLI